MLSAEQVQCLADASLDALCLMQEAAKGKAYVFAVLNFVCPLLRRAIPCALQPPGDPGAGQDKRGHHRRALPQVHAHVQRVSFS